MDGPFADEDAQQYNYCRASPWAGCGNLDDFVGTFEEIFEVDKDSKTHLLLIARKVNKDPT